MYKLSRIHVVIDTLSFLPNITSVPNQTTDTSFFYIEPKWLNDVKENLKLRQIEGTLSVQQK